MQESDFESIKQINVLGHDYWSARDLQKALGYEASWQNFEKVIRAAMVAAMSPEVGLKLEEHFNEVVKMSKTGQGGQRKKRTNRLMGKILCSKSLSVSLTHPTSIF